MDLQFLNGDFLFENDAIFAKTLVLTQSQPTAVSTFSTFTIPLFIKSIEL